MLSPVLHSHPRELGICPGSTKPAKEIRSFGTAPIAVCAECGGGYAIPETPFRQRPRARTIRGTP